MSSVVRARDVTLFGLMPILLVTMSLSGCEWWVQKQAQKLAQAPETQAKVEALKTKTLKQLSHVPGGGFWMGDFGVLMNQQAKDTDVRPGPDAKPGEGLQFTIDTDNKPPKWVDLDAFLIQQYKVTYGDFDVFLQANALPAHPPKGDDDFHRIWQQARTGDDVPAGVAWQQAKNYCLWLGKLTGLPFDLPTEAQWEFAASNRINSYRQPFPTTTGQIVEGKTHPTFQQQKKLLGRRGALYPVGRYAPSPLGLYDLVGNGLEWMNDWYAPDAYQHGTSKNPTGPATGSEKVLRGKSAHEDFSPFPHVMRYHKDPGLYISPVGDEPFPFTRESFRCVVNRLDPIR
ncbi:MAG: SUMF1/EgtB/PvdO family nonheme iron enzyme [Aquabacterium sp.]|uniref:formylglycine-generating enzyme family protein n=1 Tax=Aquabacterium sp. TaxID=1872578 RepID=UPI0025C02E5D|nr:SUMF1/EgtB/PvdO family nonheme iron enzyme [Aquabacterium sp.]MBI5924492.1 SUMF1/EgtB/PvdO family nonheme iron enzyme [Aquabacterium sp.]